MSSYTRSENAVKNAVINLLRLHGIWAMRINTGAFSAEHRGKRRFVRFALPGTADIMATPQPWVRYAVGKIEMEVQHPAVLWIETKRPGRKGAQSPAQLAFEKDVVSRGHYYLLVDDPAQVLRWLQEHAAI